MTHGRSARDRRAALERADSMRRVVRLGSWKVSAGAFAVCGSLLLHGGAFTAVYFAAGGAVNVTDPKIEFARGEQATQVQVLLAPWPDAVEDQPADEPETKPEQRDHEADADAEDVLRAATMTVTVTVTVQAEKVETVSVPPEAPQPTTPKPSAVMAEDPGITQDAGPYVAPDAIPGAQVGPDTDRDSPDAVEAPNDMPRPEEVVETVPPVSTTDDANENLQEPTELLASSSPVSTPSLGKRPPAAEASVHNAEVPPAPVPSKASPAQKLGVETGIELLDLPKPKYPSLSRRQGEEGLVMLYVEVLPDGSVGDVTVLEDAGYRRLADAAIAAARRGHFRPATRDGRPVADKVRIPFRFVLR